MTIYDKGLLRAMKQAYREDGYYVAVTEKGILIQAENWGCEILADAVPNSVKSLIVLHNGCLPRMNTAVCVAKAECSAAILEVVVGTLDDMAKVFDATGGIPIKPTRLTMDGCRIWQTTDNLKARMVDLEDQQILAGESFDAHLVSGAVYGRSWFGSMFVRTKTVKEEDKPLLDHLSKMQWIPVDEGD